MTVSPWSVLYTKEAPKDTLYKDVMVSFAASILLAIVARISLPLPFTPIPLSLGPQAVLFLALYLGPFRGTLAALFYVLEGLVGVPVFSQGKCGLLALLGPTGGYLMGYIAGAFVTGYIDQQLKRARPSSHFIALACGNMVIYLFGAVWLSRFVGATASLTLGVLPFIVMDFIKTVTIARLCFYLRGTK